MNLNERISKIIEYSELTSSEFADEVEVQRSSISHITSGRNKPSLDFLMKVKERFPELQWDWMINGTGEMTLKREETEENPTPSKPASLPDLFALINDENFGYTESDDRVQKPNSRELNISEPITENRNSEDSQRLEPQKHDPNVQFVENQQDKIKRIVVFFESGKFESYEP